MTPQSFSRAGQFVIGVSRCALTPMLAPAPLPVTGGQP
jgi:hypothetical protein